MNRNRRSQRRVKWLTQDYEVRLLCPMTPLEDLKGKVGCRRMQSHNLVPNVSSLETLTKEIKYEFQGGHMAGED